MTVIVRDRPTLPPVGLVREFVNKVKIVSILPHNPVEVANIPADWELLGTGNYAAVFAHSDYQEVVVKIYAENRSGWSAEVEVYQRLGNHQSFSQCFYQEPNWLILKRLHGITLYDCVHRGIKIPHRVIQDIDRALNDVQANGLTPHDVHGRNVMMSEGKGLVVDISDFLDASPCRAWQDLKTAYYWLYLPLLSWHSLSIPYWLLDTVRGTYRWYRLCLSLWKG